MAYSLVFLDPTVPIVPLLHSCTQMNIYVSLDYIHVPGVRVLQWTCHYGALTKNPYDGTAQLSSTPDVQRV